jgi:hypothetical protein
MLVMLLEILPSQPMRTPPTGNTIMAIKTVVLNLKTQEIALM